MTRASGGAVDRRPSLPSASSRSSGTARSRRIMLHVLATLSRPFAANAPLREGPLLLIRPDHVGDLLFVTPALRRLKQSAPGTQLTCMVGRWSEDVVARNPNVADVIRCDFPWFNGRRASILERYRLLAAEAIRLRRRSFAAAVNLRFDFWWGAALAHLAGIPYRLGYAHPDCLPFLSNALPYEANRHEVLQNVSLADGVLAALGLAPRQQEFGALEYPVSEAERAFARQYLSDLGLAGRPLLVIHPGSRAAIKRWPADRFARVANKLAPRIDARVVITGGAAERELAAQIATGVACRAVNAAGDTSLGQLAAILEQATLIIGVDSGPLHLAVALGRPSVHLFGPADHRAFGPFGPPERHVVVRADLECGPCGRLDWQLDELADHECMPSIGVEQVVQAAERALESATLVVPTLQNG